MIDVANLHLCRQSCLLSGCAKIVETRSGSCHGKLWEQRENNESPRPVGRNPHNCVVDGRPPAPHAHIHPGLAAALRQPILQGVSLGLRDAAQRRAAADLPVEIARFFLTGGCDQPGSDAAHRVVFDVDDVRIGKQIEEKWSDICERIRPT